MRFINCGFAICSEEHLPIASSQRVALVRHGVRNLPVARLQLVEENYAAMWRGLEVDLLFEGPRRGDDALRRFLRPLDVDGGALAHALARAAKVGSDGHCHKRE